MTEFHYPGAHDDRPAEVPLTRGLRDTLVILGLGNLNGVCITAALFLIFGWGCK